MMSLQQCSYGVAGCHAVQARVTRVGPELLWVLLVLAEPEVSPARGQRSQEWLRQRVGEARKTHRPTLE